MEDTRIERNEEGELEPTTDENYRDGWDSIDPGDDDPEQVITEGVYVESDGGTGRPQGLPERPRGVTLSDER